MARYSHTWSVSGDGVSVRTVMLQGVPGFRTRVARAFTEKGVCLEAREGQQFYEVGIPVVGTFKYPEPVTSFSNVILFSW